MTLILIIAGLAIIAGVSQWYDERERAKRAREHTALRETERLCRLQAEQQSRHTPRHQPDRRDVARLAGKPIAPHNDKRNYAA